jgi:excisionase family DNA binding protein
MKADGKRAVEGQIEFEPPLWDANKAAGFLGIHPVTLTEFARQGRIPAIKVGKVWRFRPSSLKRWLDVQEQNRG